MYSSDFDHVTKNFTKNGENAPFIKKYASLWMQCK